MARVVQVKVFDGKENTLDETIVSYQIGIPSDVMFYTKNDTVYAQWWNMNHPPKLVSVPCYQIVSID